MKLKEFPLKRNNHFVAMEYYWLILNRTFLILMTKEYIIGIQGNGVIAVEGGKDFITGLNCTEPFVKNLAVRGDLSNPFSYLKEKYINNIKDEDLMSNSFLINNKANFRINKKDIKNVYYDSNKKWGMSYYPHDGKVYIETFDKKKKELIILGNQSGQAIANWISS
jgi:hypothetical protein